MIGSFSFVHFILLFHFQINLSSGIVSIHKFLEIELNVTEVIVNILLLIKKSTTFSNKNILKNFLDSDEKVMRTITGSDAGILSLPPNV